MSSLDSGLVLDSALESALTAPVAEALRTPGVTNVHLNVGGHVVVQNSDGKTLLPDLVSERQRELIINTVSGLLDLEFSAKEPSVSGSLCGGRLRIQGFGKPVSPAANLAFRVQPKVRFTLDQLVGRRMLTESLATTLVERVVSGETVLLAGSTNSGKTTLARAFLTEVLRQQPLQRFVVLEEEAEELMLHRPGFSVDGVPAGVEVLPLCAKENHELQASDLVRKALRANAEAIVVGEIRGKEAHDFYKAALTGHRGSVLTVHAGKPFDALTRLSLGCEEAKANVPEHRWVPIIDCVVVIKNYESFRRVTGAFEIDKSELGTTRVCFKPLLGVDDV